MGWMRYPLKSLNFIKMVRQSRRMLSMVVSIELGNVVYLYIILDAVPKAGSISLISTLSSLTAKGSILLAVTSWSVSVVLTTLQVSAVVILEFLLEWQSVEFTSQGKLAVNFFLADIEVFDVEEA